ncbi:hypothetical protein C2845_PM01G25820 [Panicum miliaceum]|uniref:DUF6598 domain-containing protein n=1 Tax=Panicum miliaceum TaxID=4540 RepID=A0A3L6TSW5_PANMI|nr:hypothetical protein C2845_PM01G25820 [Panicum miliaceum]
MRERRELALKKKEKRSLGTKEAELEKAFEKMGRSDADTQSVLRNAKAKPGPPFLELNSYDHKLLESSVNIVSLTIHVTDMDYPIKVFGTVLARDQVDYKCVYLFRRDKDDPQVINSPNWLILCPVDKKEEVHYRTFSEKTREDYTVSKMSSPLSKIEDNWELGDPLGSS